jgi:hypothetical protein
MSETKTPRTDANEELHNAHGWVDASFARQLEREIAEAREAALEEAAKICEEVGVSEEQGAQHLPHAHDRLRADDRRLIAKRLAVMIRAARGMEYGRCGVCSSNEDCWDGRVRCKHMTPIHAALSGRRDAPRSEPEAG